MWCYTLFPIILNMSLTAGIVIVLVLLARLLLKKAPKVFSYVLWAVVLFRLLCPISFSSGFSLLGIFNSPTATNGSIAYIPTDIVHTANPQVDFPLPGISQIINEILPQNDEQTVADPLEAPMSIVTFLWLFGIAAILIYSIVSVLILKKHLKSAKHIERNIYETDNLKTPFVFGIFRPEIFIPAELAVEEKSYIIRHEQTHIRRLDHIIKPFAFLVLSIHWFNPLAWVAFVLMSTDMELSCDERVIKEMGGEIKKAYSSSLLSLATGKRILNGSPLAFGEGNVKGRIKNVLNYKKPAFWIIAVAVLSVITLSIGLVTNPESDMLTQNQAEEIARGVYPSAISITAGNEQKIHGTFKCYTFEVQLPENNTKEILAIAKKTGGVFTYNQNDGRWDVYTGVIEKAPITSGPLTINTTVTDPIQIGRIAFSVEYMGAMTSKRTPVEDRIASFHLNDISLLAGDINEFCVSLNYDFTTDNDSYLNPARGAKGKGTWPDNYMEIRIKRIERNKYEIISIGTGGGGQGLTPYTAQQTSLEPITVTWSPEQSIDAVGMAELDYASYVAI